MPVFSHWLMSCFQMHLHTYMPVCLQWLSCFQMYLHACVPTVAGCRAFKHTIHAFVLTMADVLSNIPYMPICPQWVMRFQTYHTCLCAQWLDVVLSNIPYMPVYSQRLMCFQAYHTCLYISNITYIHVCSQWLDVMLSNIPYMPICLQWVDVNKLTPKIVMVCCIY